MKTSTEIYAAARIVGYEKAVELVGKAGFDAWDFSLFDMWKCSPNEKRYDFSDYPIAQDNYLDYARKLRKIGEDNGIVCNQSHAPFPCIVQHFSLTEKFLKRSIELTAEAGGKICVIHPGNRNTVEENAEMYFKLLPFAKQYGVKIATENMWSWDVENDCATFASCGNHENFKALIDFVNDDFFVACLDIGHAEMRGLNTSSVKMIHTLGDKVEALHIHDNDCHHDLHQIPFSMNIDFIPIVKALREIGYKGWINLEAMKYLDKFDKDNVLEGLCDLHSAAVKIEELFLNN